MEDAVRQLPDGMRQVFVLYDVEGYQHDEIGTDAGHFHRHVEVTAAPGPHGPATAPVALRKSTMTHDTWTDRLSEYVDGELDAATTRALETHLAGCAECRAIADDLRQVVGPRPGRCPRCRPRPTCGRASQSRIHEDGVVPLRATAPQRLFVSWPRLAAAGLLLGLVSGGAVYARDAPVAADT